MVFDGHQQRLLICLPALGAAFDVGEEEGDDSAGILGLGRLRGCCAAARVAMLLVPAQREV